MGNWICNIKRNILRIIHFYFFRLFSFFIYALHVDAFAFTCNFFNTDTIIFRQQTAARMRHEHYTLSQNAHSRTTAWQYKKKLKFGFRRARRIPCDLLSMSVRRHAFRIHPLPSKPLPPKRAHLLFFTSLFFAGPLLASYGWYPYHSIHPAEH